MNEANKPLQLSGNMKEIAMQHQFSIRANNNFLATEEGILATAIFNAHAVGAMTALQAMQRLCVLCMKGDY